MHPPEPRALGATAARPSKGRFPQPRFPKPRTNIFDAVNAAAAARIEGLSRSWLGRCKRVGDNLMALNPTRADKNIGSFGINIRTGVWADFATGDKGGDIVSFYAYLRGLTQIEAARELAVQLGVQA